MCRGMRAFVFERAQCQFCARRTCILCLQGRPCVCMCMYTCVCVWVCLGVHVLSMARRIQQAEGDPARLCLPRMGMCTWGIMLKSTGGQHACKCVPRSGMRTWGLALESTGAGLGIRPAKPSLELEEGRVASAIMAMGLLEAASDPAGMAMGLPLSLAVGEGTAASAVLAMRLLEGSVWRRGWEGLADEQQEGAEGMEVFPGMLAAREEEGMVAGAATAPDGAGLSALPPVGNSWCWASSRSPP